MIEYERKSIGDFIEKKKIKPLYIENRRINDEK